MLPIPSTGTTQRVTRVQSPVREASDTSMLPTQQAAAQLAAMAAAPNTHGVQHVAETHNTERETSVVPKISEQEMRDAGTLFFNLRITDMQTTTINYNPANAIDNTNANLQDYIARMTNIPDLPASLFQLSYREPDYTDLSSSAKKYGYFFIGVPEPVFSIMPEATNPIAPDGPLAFTADDNGNIYKLVYEEYIRREAKAYDRIDPNDPHWMHVKPRQDCELAPMIIKARTQTHIAKFGLTIRDHEEAFKKLMNKEKTASRNMYHTVYDICHGQTKYVDTPNGPTIDVRGIQRFLLDEDTNEYASIVFHKEPMEKALSSCHVCYAPLFVCGGCKEPAKQITGGKKPMTAEQKNAAAQHRLSKKVKQHKFK